MINQLYVAMAYEMVDTMIRTFIADAIEKGMPENEFEILSKELDELRSMMHIKIHSYKLITMNEQTFEGFIECREIPGRGLCGLQRMAFTVGLFYGLQANPFYDAYDGRYCYPTWREASEALKNWDGAADPPDENWIKHKGHTEYSNPNNPQTKFLIQ